MSSVAFDLFALSDLRSRSDTAIPAKAGLHPRRSTP